MPGFQGAAGCRRTAVMVVHLIKGFLFLKANFSHQSTDPVIRPTRYFGYEMASPFWSDGVCLLKDTFNRSHTSAPSPLLAVADSEGSITFYQEREVIHEHNLDQNFSLMDLLCVAISRSNLLNTMCTVRHLMSFSGLVKSQDGRIVSPTNTSFPKHQALNIVTVI